MSGYISCVILLGSGASLRVFYFLRCPAGTATNNRYHEGREESTVSFRTLIEPLKCYDEKCNGGIYGIFVEG